MKQLFLVFNLLLFVAFAKAQKGRDQIIDIIVEPTANSIKLSWPNETRTDVTYNIYRKDAIDDEWKFLKSVDYTVSVYEDKDVVSGKGYEYNIGVTFEGQAQTVFGYVYAGHKRVLNPLKGRLMLLIDSTYIDSLADELDVYQNDAEAGGYQVFRLYAGRDEKPSDVKKRIVDLYKATPGFTTLFIVGHVPVAYSGNFSSSSTPPPDGHVEGLGNHTGAWPADVYYGDIDGQWNDNGTNNTTGKLERNHNVPGDGKFDHSKLPSDVELEIGRVDLTNMPAFTKYSDIELTRRYFHRLHGYKTNQWESSRRAIMDDNFKVHNLGATGYQLASNIVGSENLDDTSDLIPTAKQQDYLLTIGIGAGGFSSCNRVGKTADWASDSVHSTFTLLAGSYFGDWDSDDNFLRAPLASNSLASAWAGLPRWHLHHMALGEQIGMGTKLTQNNLTEYFGGLFNGSERGIHIALMGDPTLRLLYTPPVTGLTAESKNGNVELSWTAASGNFEGYLVYKITEDGKYKLVTSEPITSTSYTDNANFYSGTYTYAVFTTRLEKTASGTYYNIGNGSWTTLSHVNSTQDILTNNSVHVFPNPTTGMVSLETPATSIQMVSIRSLSGDLLYSSQIQSTTQLNLSSLAKGIYILEVENEFSLVKKKLVIQ
ncbi:MAG: T9SS type A sorting domain-containing protein [Bacteroidetes bacterium]|nr:T9SS type A sorting domain-containing protein [Bacteroidota bacterium]